MPIDFEVLKTNTKDLSNQLSITLKRYSLGTDATNTAEKKLLWLITQVETGVLKSDTDRETELELFSLLLARQSRPYLGLKVGNEPNQVVSADKLEELHKQAIDVLLGSLIFRRLRLERSYNQKDAFAEKPLKPVKQVKPASSTSWFGFVTGAAAAAAKTVRATVAHPTRTLKTCGLYVAIANALQLKETEVDNLKIPPKKMDPITILNTLKSLNEFMMGTEKQSAVPRYKSYPHLANQKDFPGALKKLIDEYSGKVQKDLKQYAAINFLQSVLEKVEDERELIKSAMVKCIGSLKEQVADFTKLTKLQIEAHIVETLGEEAPFLCSRIRNLLARTPEINKADKKIDSYEQLLAQLEVFNKNRGAYTVIGAYILLLNGDMDEISDLQSLLENALGLTPDECALKYQQLYLSCFSDYLKHNPGIKLDYLFFRDKAGMESALAAASKLIGDQIKEEAAASPLVHQSMLVAKKAHQAQPGVASAASKDVKTDPGVKAKV